MPQHTSHYALLVPEINPDKINKHSISLINNSPRMARSNCPIVIGARGTSERAQFLPPARARGQIPVVHSADNTLRPGPKNMPTSGVIRRAAIESSLLSRGGGGAACMCADNIARPAQRAAKFVLMAWPCRKGRGEAGTLSEGDLTARRIRDYKSRGLRPRAPLGLSTLGKSALLISPLARPARPNKGSNEGQGRLASVREWVCVTCASRTLPLSRPVLCPMIHATYYFAIYCTIELIAQ